MSQRVAVFVGEELGKYRFPEGHPFSIDRQKGFWAAARNQGLDKAVDLAPPRQAEVAELARFHSAEHIELVQRQSRLGRGFLDYGDTPAFPGVFEAASTVAGSALEGAERILAGENRRTFQAVGGLHHARPEGAAGFCVFNDMGVLIRALREKHGIQRIAYVDIDVHHGDGVFYAFEDDPYLILADTHEDGRYLYPGTGDATETGSGPARGTKINLPLPPGATDRDFSEAWEQAFDHIRRREPEFIILQCGADSLRGDPLAHLRLTPESHALAARTLCDLADEVCGGRLMAFGGGGYEPRNLAAAWCAVLEELVR